MKRGEGDERNDVRDTRSTKNTWTVPVSVAALASRFGMHTENVNPRKKVRHGSCVDVPGRSQLATEGTGRLAKRCGWQLSRCPAPLPA